MCSHSALCLLAVHKRVPRTWFSSEYFRRGLTKCRQKQTADDLLLITSSFFSLSVPHSSLLLFAHSPRLPRFIFLVSSLFILPTLPLLFIIPVPPLLFQRCFLPSISALPWLLTSSPTCLSFHPTQSLLCLITLPVPFLFIHSLTLRGVVLCLSARLSVFPLKGCLRPLLC